MNLKITYISIDKYIYFFVRAKVHASIYLLLNENNKNKCRETIFLTFIYLLKQNEKKIMENSFFKVFF